MNISYKGSNKDFDYRLAEINFDETEFEKVCYMANVMTIKGWKIDVVTDGYACCEVEDREEYKMFMKDWKEVKKSVALWKKYNMAY